MFTHFKYALIKIAEMCLLALPHLEFCFVCLFIFVLSLLNEIESSVNLL